MTSPKAAGTAVETAFVNYARSVGFADAERRPLAGAKDLGDVRLTQRPGTVIVECKRAMGATGVHLVPWMRETLAELGNSREAGEDPHVALLVAKPVGVGDRNVGRWFAAVPAECWESMSWYLGIDSTGSAARVNGPGGLVGWCAADPRGLSESDADWSRSGLRNSVSMSRRGRSVSLRKLGEDCVVGPVWWMLLGLRACGYGAPLPEFVLGGVR